ncbi:uncharacterized protein [Littorina saxatilis]|uniref:uncharacterized protein n=1 Tax=Littorina saxatilis TaxID=31220 RepID=UPI0038B60ED7
MYELKSHKAKHFDDHPFECTWRDCGKAFKTKSDCTKHMKRHGGTRSYMCSICGKGFFCSTMLKRHAAAHSDVRNFECGECLKKFKTRKALETHIHTHQEIKPYQCDVCYKTFNSQSNMNTHMRVHGAGRPYQCPICMHGSREMDHLMTHFGQNHLHNFTYICGLCRKPFGKSMHLQFHIQRCHKKEMDGRQEVMAFDPEYLGLDLQPEPSGAFDPATYAKYLAAETTASFGGKTFIAKSSPVKKEPRLSGTSEDRGISSGSTNSPETGSRSPGSLPLPPVVQVARFGGVPVCLARKNAGVQMNCQKRGKKPKYWFMDASLMTEEDREKHFEYLRKKEDGLLPQSRRGKKYKQKTVSWQPKSSTSGTRKVKGKGKEKRKRRRVVLDTEEEDSEEEEAYRLAQEVMIEVDRPNTSSTEFPERVSSRKRTVMIKNVPHDVFDQPPKKNLAFTSTNLHDARNKAANRSQNKKIVKKKLHQKSTKSRAKSPKRAPCYLQKLPSKKRCVSSYMEKDRSELGISWDLTSESRSSVSHYSVKMAAANSKCWTDAVSLAANTGCYRLDKHTDINGSSIPKEKCTDDMREEFSGQCPQPQDQTPSDMNGHDPLCSDPSAGDVVKKIQLSGVDLAKRTCLGVENTHEESGASVENDICLQSVTDGPDDASILRDTTECLEGILNAVSAGCIRGEVLLPSAADISDACIWQETSECLSALVDTASGGSPPTKNTIDEVTGPNELSVQECAESQQIGRPQVNQFLSALSQSNISETIAASLPSQQSFGADTIKTVAAETAPSSEKDDHLELLPAERDNRKRIEDSNKCLHVLVSDVCVNHHALDKLNIFGVHKVSLDVPSASPQHSSPQKQKVIKSRQQTANKTNPAQSPMKAAGRAKASPQTISKRKELAQKTDTALVKKPICSSAYSAENAEAPGIGGLLLATAAVSKASKSPETTCKRVGRPLGKNVGRPPGKKVGKLPGKTVGRPPGKRVGRPPGKKVGRPPGERVGRPPGKAAALGSKEPNHIASPKKTRMLDQSKNRSVEDLELVEENHEAADSQDSPSFTIKMELDEPESVDAFCVVGTLEHEHTEQEGDDSVNSDNENAMSPHNVAVGNSEAINEAAVLQSTKEKTYTSEKPKAKTNIEQTKISAESSRKRESSPSAKLSDNTKEMNQPDTDSLGVASKDDLTKNQNVTQNCLQSNEESTADPCSTQNSHEDTSSPDASSSPAPSPQTSPRKSERARKATPPVMHPHSKKVVENLRKLLNKVPYSRLPAGVKKLGIFQLHHQNAASNQNDQLGAAKKLSFDNETVIATAKLSGDLEETERTVCKAKAPNSSAEFSGDFEKVYEESTDIPVHTDDNLEREEAARVVVVAEPSSVNNEAELQFSLKELDVQNNQLHIQEKPADQLGTAEYDDERQQDPSKDKARKTFLLETPNTKKQIDAASSFSVDRDAESCAQKDSSASSFSVDRDAESCAQKDSSASKTDQGFDTDIQKKVSSDESGSKKCAANIEHNRRNLDKDTERYMHRNGSPEKVSQSLVNVAHGKNASEKTEAEAGETNDEMSTTVSDNNFLAGIDEARIMQRDPSSEILDENPPKDGQTVTTFSQSTTSSEDFQSITSTVSNNINSANMDEGRCMQTIPDKLTVQESAISDESSGTQEKPKRKVGRPRKSPTPSLNASEVVSNKSTAQVTMYSSELPSDTKVKIKRNAGRPRKTSVPVSESGGLVSNSGIVTERLESYVHSGTKVTLKRRVGRPKKTSVLGLKAGDVVSNNNALQDKAADIVPSGAAVKIATNAEVPQGACLQVSDNRSIQEMVVSDAPSSTEVKRKVGRPQKKPLHGRDTSDVVSNSSTVQEEVVSRMSLHTGPELKRKPRKSLLQGSGISNEKKTVQKAVSSVSFVMQGNHPKKGGRPRKHPVEQSSDSRTVQAADVPYGTEVNQPQKVGRPCKNPVDRSVADSRLAQETGVKQPRKVGRPRKQSLPGSGQEQRKKKVGRARKHSLPGSCQEQQNRVDGSKRKPQAGSRVMGKEHFKLWAKIKKAQASSTKPSAKQKAFLTAASAAAKTIVKRSRNSAFKILKPNSSPLLKRAENEMTKKRKRFMYVETDMGTSPDPPPKKRGRKPGPKIVLDRSQTNLCFEPQQLMMSADQVGDNLGDNSSFFMDVSSLGVQAIAGEEKPSLLVLQPGPLGSSLTQGTPLQIPVQAESQLISAVLPTQIVVSASASLLSGCAQASLLQKNILSINSDIREVPDIKPDIFQLNEAMLEDSACLLPDVKPLIDELRYLNQAGMGQIDEPAASQLSTVEEPTNMNSMSGDQILSQPEETPQSHTGSDQPDETSEPVPEVTSSTLTQSCTPSQGGATQLCTVVTCQPSLSSVSSQNAKRRPMGKPPGKPVRKKAKDPIFISHVKDTVDPRFVQDTERRRSYRPKKQRLTDEQIRRAQCQDSVDSDLDDGEDDDGSDIEFVSADYTKVDPATKKQFLENLRLDVFPFGQEGGEEESADTNQDKINNTEQNEDNAETLTAMRTDEMEASNNPINERDNDDDEEVWGEVSADLLTDADVVQDNTVNCPSDAEPVGSVDGLKTDMQAMRGITEDPSTDAETVRVITGQFDTDVVAIRGITGDLTKDSETKMGVTRSLFTDVEDNRGITDIPTDTEAMRGITVKLSTEAEAVRSICLHSEEVPAATKCKIEDGCCNCQDVKPDVDSKDHIITNLPAGVKDKMPDIKTENIKNSLSFSAEECFLSAAPGLDADVFVDNFPTLAGPAVSLAEHVDMGVTQDQRLASLGGVQQLPQTPPAHRVQVPITPGGDQASPSLTIFVKTSDGQRVWLEEDPQSFVKDEFTQ